jgi:hypothetical protein
MAASFRIERDPTARFAELRDRPRKEAEDRSRKRVTVAPTAPLGMRPRPVRLRNADGTPRRLAGVVGWREHVDGDWSVSNDDNAYLPLGGIAAALAADRVDPGLVYFYYSATVRVEEESDDSRLTTLRWYLDELPEVQRLWREGKLVAR